MGRIFKSLLSEDKKMLKHIFKATKNKNPNKKFEYDYQQWTLGTRVSLEKSGSIKPRRTSTRFIYPTR